jgi:hypothetical protein
MSKKGSAISAPVGAWAMRAGNALNSAWADVSRPARTVQAGKPGWIHQVELSNSDVHEFRGAWPGANEGGLEATPGLFQPL